MLPDQRRMRIPGPQGELIVPRAVLTAVVARAAQRTPGVAALGEPLLAGGRIGRLLELALALAWRVLSGAPRWRGVRVDLGVGEVGVALEVVARWGVDLRALAHELRDRVTAAVQEAAGLEVRCVDVVVCGWSIDPLLERQARARPAAEARSHFALGQPHPLGGPRHEGRSPEAP